MKQRFLNQYSVQPIKDGVQAPKSACRTVEAMGPLQAAELALGETLSTTGPVEEERAIVRWVEDDLSLVSVTLYRPTN